MSCSSFSSRHKKRPGKLLADGFESAAQSAITRRPKQAVSSEKPDADRLTEGRGETNNVAIELSCDKGVGQKV
jgi:hypothetical protein